MNEHIISLIARQLELKTWQVEHSLTLFAEGATLPFVSRYRKEATGSLDEVTLEQIKLLGQRYEEIEKRKQAILQSIEEQGKLTDELRTALTDCYNATQLEDLYLPYRPKRRTRASVAREKGLEPLAQQILSLARGPMEKAAEAFVNEQVPDVQAALAGACDIVAETVSEHAGLRASLRACYRREAVVKATVVKAKEAEAAKYRNYFNFSEPLSRIPSHRLMALLRGGAEGFLTVKLQVPEAGVQRALHSHFLPGKGRVAPAQQSAAALLEEALQDAYKRLIHPSLENERLKAAKEKADAEAIQIFATNLRQLLLEPPLGQKRILAIDPGFRTGCKVVCLDAQGQLLHNDTIYPHPPQNERSQSLRKLVHMVEAYKIEVIALGNGTAGRETEQFLKKIAFPREVKVFSVSEDGASVYSASAVAREEFPNYDVTVRGAVSIGRRLMDPLAELVKIDPKSIGVGQYQHDVDQNALRESLDVTVESCVNHVGVNLNTASKELLTYVSGLGPQLAGNIVEYRNQNGSFASRAQLMEVKRMGAKTFEQCAGFLRIPQAAYALDNTAVHPERYALVERMAADCGVDLSRLLAEAPLREGLDLNRYVSEEVGLPTLKDIMAELAKPGRDPRSTFKVMEFDESLQGIEDLREGMILPGIVSNLTAFGAFVDIGIKQDGLVHVSQLGADRRVSDPSQVLRLHQHVQVRVLSVDLERNRIQLSMKGLQNS